MSGWDVSDVETSGQRVAGVANTNDSQSTRLRALTKFYQFLHQFQDDSGLVYDERLRTNYNAGIYTCIVDFRDLSRFDAKLADELRNSPADLLPIFESAAKQLIFRTAIPQVAESAILDIQIQIVGFNRFTTLRTLNAENMSRLVAVPESFRSPKHSLLASGIVVSASRANTKASRVALQCRNCLTLRYVSVGEGFGGGRIPRKCDHVPLNPDEERCPLDPFTILSDKSEFYDTQTLKLQEAPEAVPTGEMPRTIQLHLSRYLVNLVKPGSRIIVIGIQAVFEGKSGAPRAEQTRGPSSSAVRQPYLRVIGLQIEGDGTAGTRVAFSLEEEEQMKEIARDDSIYQRLAKSVIAPEIYGRDDIKKAVAAQLFSGVRQVLPDGIKLRGDIHVLLLGDPSVAKSQFLKFAEKCSPIAVYTSGKGSSAAGLTASVIRDSSSGEFHLEGGALVLADGGIVCIDEFDKMRQQDRVAIHEAMEQQTISIAKAGITTILNSRAGVLAAANPVFGHYDDLKSPEENIEFQSTILSRFDMIFIIQDRHDAVQDAAVTRHVLRMYQGTQLSNRDSFQDALFKDMATLKKYVAYARQKCNPCLSAEAHTLLVNRYVTMRENMRKQAQETGVSVIPITVRQLEAIIRISESLARMQLSPVASIDHVNEAVRLFQVSTLNAAQSGIISGEGLAGSAYGESVKKAEARIKRRLAIGAEVGVRKLVQDLAGAGDRQNVAEDERAVFRALQVMESSGEIAYVHQRKLVKRLK